MKPSGVLSKEMEEQLWHLFSPCTEEEFHKSFRIQNKDVKIDKKKPSRPLTGMKDSVGHEVVSRAPLFRRTAASMDAHNIYNGPSDEGLPDGFGCKQYAKVMSWEGILLPYGAIMDAPKYGPAMLIPVARYVREVGILHRYPGAILLADDEDRIQSYEHCHKVLERLRFVQKVTPPRSTHRRIGSVCSLRLASRILTSKYLREALDSGPTLPTAIMNQFCILLVSADSENIRSPPPLPPPAVRRRRHRPRLRRPGRPPPGGRGGALQLHVHVCN